jgi:hypothetical protein
MKTKSLFLTVAAAILFTAGSITLSGCGNSSNNKSTEHVHKSTEVNHDHDMDNKHENGEMAEAHYQCPMKCEGDKMYDKPGKCPVCKMELKKVNKDIEVAHYQCPMKCEGDKMYDKPGKCPVCKMDLKKVKEDSGHEGHNH